MRPTARPPAPIRNSMRPPPRPQPYVPSVTGRAASPVDSVASRAGSHPPSPGGISGTGTKRKERDFDHDGGEETNIHVVVRCRGRSEREVRENSGVVVSTNGVKGKNVELSMGPNAISNKSYHFDKVFSPAADQSIIYEDVVSPILDEMLAGYNCTIFAYGQTGTGKTYTMSGDMTDTLGILSDAAGIIPRVLYSLFRKLESDEVECSVKCSFIELYNEELRDLLSVEENAKLKIYDDASRKSHSATMVQGMEESHIKNASEGIKLLQQGSHRRQVAATRCNDLSSRSHTVFTITTYMKKPNDAGEDYICAGKLNLVDLAGSENIQRSGAENKRAAEAGLINKSLLTLGRVINALVDKSSHIPYRESKLTRLLQDSLGGRTKTCIIATVSPAKSNLEETISTLDYAFRAKNIRNKPQVNSMISKKTLLREFTVEIEKLKSELIATRQRNGVYLSNEQFEEITVESESRRILSEEQKARIETMESSLRNKVQELFSLTNTFQILKRDNDATRIALENTKDVLLQTEIVLRDTRQNLAEETALREAHQKTEETLYGVGTDLVVTLNDSVHDIGGLHAKLQRRSELHDNNRTVWESSTARAAEVSQQIDGRIAEFQVQHSQLVSCLTNRIESFVASELSRVAQSQTCLVQRQGAFESCEQSLLRQSSGIRDEMNNVLEEIKVLREEVKVKVGEGLQGLSAAAARISGEVITELEAFHTQLHASYAGLGRDFKSIFEDVTDRLQSQRTLIDQLSADLQESNQHSITANEAVASKVESGLEEERTASEEDRQQLLAQISALIDASAKKQDARMTERALATSVELANLRTRSHAANQAYKEGVDIWVQQDGALLENVVRTRDDLKSRMKNDWNTISAHNTSIQSSTRAVHEETIKIVDAQLETMSTQMTALDSFVTRARGQNDQHYDQHIQSLGQLSNTFQETFSELDQTFQTANTAAMNFQISFHADAMALGSSTQPLTDSIQHSLTDFQAAISSAKPLDYHSTGDTPEKKEWTYPTHLPRTESHESMLARIRGLPDPTVAKTPSTARTPGRSPRKNTSPRKAQPASPSKTRPSPTKMRPSPSKTKIYNDVFRNGSATSVLVPMAEPGPAKSGLKEIDINLIQRPPSADDCQHAHPQHQQPKEHNPTVFSTSLGSGSGVHPPPLKRHATAMGVEGQHSNSSRTQAKHSGKGRENVNVSVSQNLSQSIGPGIVGGRRLRSSPRLNDVS